MIQAVFYFDAKEQPVGFHIEGHAGYANSGADIICASVSSPAYMVANTLTEILQLHPTLQVDEQKGLFSLQLNESEREAAKSILQGFYLHLKSLSQMYTDYIEVERGAFNA